MTQIALPDAPRFDGSTYLPFRDDERLTGLLLPRLLHGSIAPSPSTPAIRVG